ncbi:MAG: hypothetical protein WC728_15545 [Elusimicrobiota bacterium]
MAAEFGRFRRFPDPLYIAAACLFLLSAVVLVLMIHKTLKGPEKIYSSVDVRGEGTFPSPKEEPRQEESKLEDVSSLDLVPKRTVPASDGEIPEEEPKPAEWGQIIKQAEPPKQEAPPQPPRTAQPSVKPKLKLLQREAGSGQAKSGASSSAFLAAPTQTQKPGATEKAPEKAPEPAPSQPQKQRVWRDMDGNFEQK